jgi:hypothetical protein
MADAHEISEAIWRVLSGRAPVLFAGAGVSMRVGLPDWAAFLEGLAAECERWQDLPSAAAIRDRVARHQFLNAGTVFKTSDLIPEGERWKALAEPFRRQILPNELDRLIPLIDLPFSGVVTTNYDHVLHQACVQSRKWFVPIERGDGTLRGAMFQKDFFIARIHGRSEVPQSMAFTKEDYGALESETDYLDFLMEVFRSRTCLFVGFSFVDPAIDAVLRTYEAKHGPNFNALHLAIVPAGATDLTTRLRRLNIQVSSYDPSDSHAELWRAVRLAYQAKGGRPAPSPPETSAIRRFVAFAYAQVQLDKDHRRGVAGIVTDGVVMSLLAEQPDKARLVPEMAEELARLLRVTQDEARQALVASLDRLATKQQVIVDGDEVLRMVDPPQLLNDHLRALAQRVANRVRVRHGVRLPDDEIDGIAQVLERLLAARAWDLSAHYAGAGVGVGSDVYQAVERLVKELGEQRALSAAEPVKSAILDMVRLPEDGEAALLTQLGRAAFGLQLLLATPRQALLQQFALPQRLYLDSNVLMPAISDGHPLQTVYVEALRRLGQAAQGVDVQLEVAIGDQFLNEVVSHRQIAKELVETLGLDDPTKLEQHVLFRGSLNSNVFVAGFAARSRSMPGLRFQEYLRTSAPYENERELADYLDKTLNIRTRAMVFASQGGGRFGEIFSDLLDGYESARNYDPLLAKEKILVQHEAQQLTQLSFDMEQGFRSLFVTADEKLRRIIHRVERLHRFAGMAISQVGLVSLVDVMVGLEADNRSWVKLMWATPQGSDEEALMEYFIRVGLARYQEGMAAEMQDAAKRVAAKAAAEARVEHLELFGAKDLRTSKAATEFLERYQDEFFQNWKDAIEHRERTGN